ncbi:MAG: hypothetical protein J6W98_05675 [Bacteroidales bacterium]|nr:hypothetical protein [Bacteroidales bacterium]
MKQSCKILIGLALIAIGVLWILDATGVFNFMFSTRGWWTLFIIVPCLFGLFNEHDKTGPCIGLGIGVLLLLTARDVITWHMFWQIALALLIIGFGVRIILFRSGHNTCKAQDLKTVSRDGKDIRRIESAFGKQTVSFAGETVEGIDVQASFGGLTLDLRGAIITEGAFIDLNVGFGGVVIIVPEDLSVQVSVSSSFGGVTDKRRSWLGSSSTSLLLTGSVGFGGVELRN